MKLPSVGSTNPQNASYKMNIHFILRKTVEQKFQAGLRLNTENPKLKSQIGTHRINRLNLTHLTGS